MRTFPTHADALAHVRTHDPGTVRVIGACNVCGTTAAADVQAAWEIEADLFGGYRTIREPAERPTTDPCSHGARYWRPVAVTKNAGETCGDGCRSATSAVCSCSCEGRRHGQRFIEQETP